MLESYQHSVLPPMHADAGRRRTGRFRSRLKQRVDYRAIRDAPAAALGSDDCQYSLQSPQVRDLLMDIRDMLERQGAHLRAGVSVTVDESQKLAHFIEAEA